MVDPRAYTVQPVSFGNYLLLEKIGSGGMAEIYRAKSFGAHGFTREYAVKKILPNLIDDEDVIGLFVDEAKLTVSLQHTNIVQVLDLGEIGRQSYIAMEYVHGKDLHELLARCARRKLRIPTKLTLYIMIETLKGLDFAHRAADEGGQLRGIVHCDVSPANVLLGYVGDVKITDFGVARVEADNTTSTDTLQGKVGYMSPEQIVGDPLDRRSDVFCAGIILYEMLTLKRLFAGNSELDVLLKVRDGDIGPELERLAHLPDELQRVVRRALAQRPQDRYQTAGEFIDELQDFAYGHRIKFTDEHLSRFLTRVFADDYKRLNHIRKSDPEDPSKFPDLLSPQVARFRFREPNGNIVGPMSVETLVSMLRFRKGTGLAVSVSYGPWLRPFEIPEIQQAFLASQESLRAQNASGSGAFSSGSQELPTIERPTTEVAKGVPESGEGTAHASLSLNGKLVGIPFASLLYRLYVAHSRGVLSVRSGDIEKAVHIDDGAPGYVATNRPTELLGNFLVQQRVLDGDQLKTTLEIMSESDMRLGDVLIDQGLLDRNALFHYLSLQTREKLMEVFSWADGEFTYQDGLSADHESYPLGIDTLEIIVEGSRARMPIEAIKAVFTGKDHAPLRILRNRQVSLERLRLTGQELSIAAVFRNGDTIAEVLRLFATSRHANEEEILRVIFLLYATRHLYFPTQE